ncbi:MAG: hypothetical protein J0626_02580, partial [Rhodospirillaceae bacterium]|nr:hypothetical protein [Rhodospirillaceae bacterium]
MPPASAKIARLAAEDVADDIAIAAGTIIAAAARCAAGHAGEDRHRVYAHEACDHEEGDDGDDAKAADSGTSSTAQAAAAQATQATEAAK